MPRTWRNLTISFGLVNAPVSIAPALDKGGVKGNWLCPKHLKKVKQQHYCEVCDGIVEEIVTGYPIGEDEYVVPDLDVLKPERTKAITLDAIVPADEISPSYYEHTYLVWPSESGSMALAFDLIGDQLKGKNLAAIGSVVLTNRERMVVLRWDKAFDSLVLHTCHFMADVRWKDVQEVQAAAKQRQEPTAEHKKAAAQLVKTLSGHFNPQAYSDNYTEEVVKLIAKLAKGQKVTPKKAKPKAEPTGDILTTLKASVKEATKKKSPPRTRSKKAESEYDPATAPIPF